jgi:hypothetical protein
MNVFKCLGVIALGVALAVGGAPNAAGDDDRGVKFRGISEKEVPKDVRTTMDQHTKGASDLFYQSQLRDGKQFYSVHYTKDGKRMFVRVDDKGKLALGPAESQAQKPKTGAGKAPVAETRREPITVEQLPAPVRKTVESATGGGTDHSFVKQTRGDEVTYVVEFTKDGQRSSAIIAPDGKIVEGETAQAAAPTPPATPDPAVAKAESDAQLAAAREATSAPYRLLGSADDLPAEVRRAAEKELAGASDPLFQRYIQDGKTAYSIHYTTLEGRRNFMAVDETGKVLIEPRKSNWQEGGKGVRFEVVGADALPAEVRKVVEEQGGTAHMFLQRTDPNGKRVYLVQFNKPGGERMEIAVSPEGKLIGNARKAREQPFTILDRKS